MKKLLAVVSLTTLFLFFNALAVYAQGNGPTQTPIPDASQICVSVYNDANSNGERDTNDVLAKNAMVEIFNAKQKRIVWFTTDGVSEPNCTRVEIGKYHIQVTVPDGYEATTQSKWELSLNPEDKAYLEFGIQKTSTISNRSTPSPAFMRAFLASIGILCFTVFIPSPFILTFILGQRIKLSDKTSSRLSKSFHVINIGSGIFSTIIIVGTWLLTQDATARGVVSIPLGIMLAISLTGEILLRTRFRK